MRYLITVIFYTIAFFTPLNAQDSDSTSITHQLERFEFSDKQSLKNYYNLSSDALNSSFGQLDKKYIRKGLYEAQKMEEDSSIANFSLLLTYSYAISDSNIDSILFYGNLMLKIGEKINPVVMKAMAHEYIGIAYLNNSNYALALNHFTQSYEVHKREGKGYDANQVLGSMASVYTILGDIPNAIKYTNIALGHLRQSPYYTENSSGFLFYQLADLYKRQNQLDSSEFYRTKNLDIIRRIGEPKEVNHKHFFLWSYLFSGEYFLEINQLDSAQIYLNLAKPFREFENFMYDELQFKYCLKSGVCKDLTKQLKTIETYKSSLSSVQFQQYLVLKRDYFKSIGEFQSALEIAEKVQSLEKERLTKERDNYAIFMDAKFENDAKEKELEQLKIDNQLKESRFQILAMGLVLSLLILSFSFYTYWQTRQKNLILKNDLKKQKLIEQQADQLKQSIDFKNRLFGNISHELRTPLTLISGQVNTLLNQSQLNTNIEQKLQLIKGNSNHLLNMANQVLDLAKNEEGVLAVNISKFQLSNLLQYLQLQFADFARIREIKMLFPLMSDDSIHLKTDADKLFIVLKNLLSNAVKYNSKGGTVTLNYEETEEKLKIIVSDTGRGISEKNLPFIFDRYYQTKQTQLSDGGIGIGLSIVKEYIQLIGGNITVKSSLNEGSTFTIELPKNHSENLTELPSYEFPIFIPTSVPVLPKLSTNLQPDNYVLVVEDNLDLCHHIFELLYEDYEVFFAHNGADALEQINLKKPSVILTDWMMPVMDGEALIKHLKSIKTLASIPILVLTARVDINDQLSLLRIGIDDYLMKPFEEEVLKAHLLNLFELAESRKQIEDLDIDNQTDLTPLFSTKEQEFLLKAEQIVLNRIADFNLTVEVVAEKLEFSTRHLSRKMKGLTGLTTQQYIQEIRFREAKRMLIEREHSTVKAVMYSIGSKTSKDFARNFKKRFGKNPSEFLK